MRWSSLRDTTVAAASRSAEFKVVANFSANIWSALLSFVLLPIYVGYIGIEAYGLLGLYASIQALSSLLDMGLSTTMNREMARASADPEYGNQARRLVRTLELVYWGVGVVLGVFLVLSVSWLANHWVSAVHLAQPTVRTALLLISAAVVLQWPFSFYSGGLMGLQRQVLLSVLQMGVSTARGIGAVIILSQISATVEAFLVWQVAVSGFSTTLVAAALWRSLPRARSRAVFDLAQLRRVWRFAAGVSAISALGLVLTQADKVVLSKVLTLEQFGYYALAGVVPAGLYLVVNPIFNVLFPRLTQLVASGAHDDVKRFYHRSAQLMSVAVIPPVVLLATYSWEVVFVWTGSSVTAEKTHVVVALLAIGTGLHAACHVPWALQLANGWTRLGFWTNLISVVILLPLTVVLSLRYGPVGGACTWTMLNLGALLVSVPAMHRRLLKGELLRWYAGDLGAPLLASLSVALLVRFTIGGDQPRIVLMTELMLLGATTLTAAALSVESTRSRISAGCRRLLRTA
jgi:O-antigen/teichoic acid export membrane protein